MKFEVERQPLSDLIGEDRELVVYDRHGSELRTLKGVIIRGGQTVREAIEAQLNPGERVRVRRKTPSA